MVFTQFLFISPTKKYNLEQEGGVVKKRKW